MGTVATPHAPLRNPSPFPSMPGRYSVSIADVQQLSRQQFSSSLPCQYSPRIACRELLPPREVASPQLTSSVARSPSPVRFARPVVTQAAGYSFGSFDKARGTSHVAAPGVSTLNGSAVPGLDCS